MWTVMQGWIRALPASTPEEQERNRKLDAELAWLVQRLGGTPGLTSDRPFVFGHCDLLSGNVIIQHQQRPPRTSPPAPPQTKQPETDDDDLTVSFIDYEYATPSPPAFDLANHFAEWVGFACDYTAIPTRSERRDFLTHYVAAYHAHDTSSSSSRRTIEQDAETLYEQVDAFRGVPGFYWGIWSLIQATISEIGFDYEGYAELRLGEYWGWKGSLGGGGGGVGGEKGVGKGVREERWAEE